MIVFIDAIDAATAMGDAILSWIVAAAFVATIVCYTGLALGTWAWRRTHRPAWARSAGRARIYARGRRRRAARGYRGAA